jgi:flavin reductase (DIM6/NTAB) family NADH-FMN oxidoreductase RutF
MSAAPTERIVTADRTRSAVGASAANEALFRKVMSRFATGVTVVTTSVGGEVFGMTANAFIALDRGRRLDDADQHSFL